MHRTFLVLAAAAALAPGLRADPPSNWTTIPLPQNLVSQPDSIGTTTTFVTTTDVWLYSGITKEWTVLPVSSPQPIFQANDYCIIQDGNLIHGYASHTGKIDTITTSGAATIVSGPASSSWVTLVADGNVAYGFGAFAGTWDSIPLTQPNPTMIANRLIGLLQDGNTVYALSAHHGTFESVAADAQALLKVVGEAEVATAISPGVFRAFSAQQNTWGTMAVPATAQANQSNEYALLIDGAQAFGYSGLTGTFATYNGTQPLTGLAIAEGVACFVDGADAVCYGSGRGQFVKRPATSPTFQLDYHFAFVVEPGGVTPFSAVTGAFGPSLPGSYVLLSNDAIGYADGLGADYAYSPLLNDWTQAPLVGPAAISLVRDAVVLSHDAGYEALSARHGDWQSLFPFVAHDFLAPGNGATFLAFDGASHEIAHVFDARLNRWATVAAQGPLTVKISRHTAMAHDGQFGYGFGQPSGEWYVEPLAAAPNAFDTASSIGTIEHGGNLSVYSVQGSFSYTGRYPEFTQANNLGSTLALHQVAPPGSQLLLLIGLEPAYLDLGASLGRLYIDPSLLLIYPVPVPVDADGILDMPIALPQDPALVGLKPQLQNFVQPPGGASPWLSSSVAPILF